MYMTQVPVPRAAVTYRATTYAGAPVELRLVIDPAAATVADAWARLSALAAEVDPRSLEIEIRAPAAPARA